MIGAVLSDCKSDICSSIDCLDFASSPSIPPSGAGTDFTEDFLFLLDFPIASKRTNSGAISSGKFKYNLEGVYEDKINITFKIVLNSQNAVLAG